MKHMLTSYRHCVEAFSTARQPHMGKPLHPSGLRLYQNPDASFRLLEEDTHLATITADDVITFVPTAERLYNTCASNLVYNLHKVLPLYLTRVSSGRYRINGRRTPAPAPEYRAGIQFNLATHQCLNYLPDRHTRADPEARRVWLRTLKEYRKGLAVRLKLGVRGERRALPPFSIPELAQWMRAGEYPDALFNRLAYEAWRSDASHEELLHIFQRFVDREHLALRMAFGVISE